MLIQYFINMFYSTVSKPLERSAEAACKANVNESIKELEEMIDAEINLL